jgi:hypothetical protein
MPVKSEYEQRIKAYIDSNPDSKMNRVQRIEIEGQIHDLPVYRLPIKLLAFNIENGRFAADLYTMEANLRRKLNTREAGDANKVQQILLNRYPNETKRFREDLRKVGQLEPGAITAAGVVINGNRRMAILIELQKETSEDRFGYLETIILPRNLNDTEIYKIEARLQYAKEFKIGYGPVNELLKMKEGLDKGMTKRQLAALLLRDEKYIEEHSAQLSLLEAYSKYAWGKIDYKKIEEMQITEQMTDVEKNVRKLKSEGHSLSEIKKLLEVQFAYIKSGCSYQDIRALGKATSLNGSERPYVDALSMLNKKRVSEESFKELIDDANEGARIKQREQKPVELAIRILEQVKRFRDNQYKITPEIKKYFLEISNIIAKLTKKRG